MRSRRSLVLTAVAGTIASYAYTYDAAGNILTLNDQLDATYNRIFAYDDLNRLITANSGASLWGTGAYTYDAMGNMLTTQLGASTRMFAYDGPRPKLTSVTEAGSPRAVTFDAAGNEIGIAAQSSTYTSRNLLAEAGESSYEYDGRGVRTIARRTESSLALSNVAPTADATIALTEPTPAADDASPEPTTGWYDDSPEHPMQMTSSSQFSSTTNTLSTLHRHSLYTLELNLMVETEMSSATAPAIAHEYIWFAGHPLAQIDIATNETAWYFTDHLGTPILQTSATATPLWRIEREPYGTPFTSRITTTRHQPLSFPGQEEELVGDISYNIFRWYRGGWGRYTQADPIGLRAGMNLYAYVKDNPIAVSDPLGLDVQYIGETNREIQVDCASATALGCTRLQGDVRCGCAPGCDRRTGRNVWAANASVTFGPIRVYFSTDCYDTGRIIVEEERHVRVFQDSIREARERTARLDGTTFSSRGECDEACREFIRGIGRLMSQPLTHGWIDFTHPMRRCDGSIPWM